VFGFPDLKGIVEGSMLLMAILAGTPVSPLAQALIVLAVGTFSTLAGFGIIPTSLDPKKAASWRKRYAATLQVGGPLLLLVGTGLLIRALSA